MSAQAYCYTALPTVDSIRIVSDLRLGKDGSIRFSFKTASLQEETPVYTALSYTWGSPSCLDITVTGERKYPVFCDDKLLLVTENLRDFFHELLHNGKMLHATTAGLPIWIDALCIDQENPDEKPDQITQMSIIYRMARRVVVWLGRENESTHLAVETILALRARTIEQLVEDLDLNPCVQYSNPDAYRPIGEFPAREKHWQALANFFARSWFYRIWVFQEVVSAFELRIQCGKFSLLWSDIVHASEFLAKSGWGKSLLQRLPKGLHGNMAFGVQPHQTQMYRKQLSEGLTWDLQLAMHMCRGLQATDHHDKVFGILGISQHNGKAAILSIRPNYNLSVQETFIRTSHIAFNIKGNLTFLHLVEDQSQRALDDLPSWIPDYTVPADVLVAVSNKSNNPSKDMATEYWHFPDKRRILQGNNKSLLDQLDLRRIGTNTAELDEITFGGESIADVASEKRGCSLWLRIIKSINANYFTGERRIDVLWRTLISNTVDGQSAAVEQTRQDFTKYIWWTLAQHRTSCSDLDSEAFLEDTLEVLDSLAKADFVDDWKLDWPTAKEVKDFEWAWKMRGWRWEKDDSKLTLNSNKIKDLFVLTRASEFENLLHRNPTYRLFRTTRGYVGLGPKSLRSGDQVHVIGGLHTPVVLRPVKPAFRDEDEHFRFIGSAYVHGLMQGEAKELPHITHKKIVLI